MNTTTLFSLAAVPAIIGLVQVAKDAGLPTRLAPLLSVLLGLLAGFAEHVDTNMSLVQAIAAGVGLGLSAAGLYHGTKTTFTGSTGTGTRLQEPDRTTTTRGSTVSRKDPVALWDHTDVGGTSNE